MRRRQISQQNNIASDLTPAVLQAPVQPSLPAQGPTTYQFVGDVSVLTIRNKGGRPKGSKNKVKNGQSAR